MCTRCEELEEKVLQLESQLYGGDWEAPREFGLTPHELAVMQALMAHERIAPHWLIYDATRTAAYAKGDIVDPKIVQIRICQIRQKLARFGLVIETIWGRGYRLESKSRTKLLNWRTDSPASRAA